MSRTDTSDSGTGSGTGKAPPKQKDQLGDGDKAGFFSCTLAEHDSSRRSLAPWGVLGALALMIRRRRKR
jgi:MYXO-CTERM domain-containing protein